MKYPISIQSFEKIINGGYAYVDKTDLVYDLAHENVCFLSRPRRFGKSLLVSTLNAYFKGQRHLFEGLKIETLEHEWKSYPIFSIDFATGNFSAPEELEDILQAYLQQWEQEYGKSEAQKSLGARFKEVLEKAYRQASKPLFSLMNMTNLCWMCLENNRKTSIVTFSKDSIVPSNRQTMQSASFYSQA